MKSIRNKLFLQIGMLTSVIFILLIVANTLFLEPFYMYRQQEFMIDSFNTIDSLFESDYSASNEEIAGILSSGNLDILIAESDGSAVYASKGYLRDPMLFTKDIPEMPIPVMEKIDSSLVEGKYYFTRVRETNFGMENLLLQGTLNNGLVLNLRIPIEAVHAGIELTNEVLVYFGITFFVLSMLFAYVLSNSFTRPVREMNAAAKRMQSLDFGTRCEVRSEDELGQLSENINSMSDILAETIRSLNIKDEKRRILLNNVSHELKTPLTLMQGYAAALKKYIHTRPERVDFYCDVIEDETVKMSRLVETLLDIDRIDLEKTGLQLREFEVNGFAEEIYRKFEPAMDEAGIKHVFEPSDEILVSCDPMMTERVLKNLLANAVNYTDERKEIRLSVLPGSDSVRIEIFNTAPEIPADELEKIWESFYKVDKARTRDRGGHGLGLSIVKAIQDVHGQGYGVRNSEKGPVFWFEMKKSSV